MEGQIWWVRFPRAIDRISLFFSGLGYFGRLDEGYRNYVQID